MDEAEFANESVEYATMLDYSPRGITPGSILSRRLIRDAVKNAQHGILDQVASILKAGEVPELNQVFSHDVILVPVPRSRPHQDFVPWPSLEICRAIEAVGLADSVWPGLRRTRAIQQSCASEKGKRPEPDDHVGSLSVIGSAQGEDTFLLVDDFVTRGSTLVSCAVVLRTAFPNAEVKGFTLVNTMGPGEEVKNILNPRFGEISYRGGALNRSSWVEQVTAEKFEEVSFGNCRNR